MQPEHIIKRLGLEDSSHLSKPSVAELVAKGDLLPIVCTDAGLDRFLALLKGSQPPIRHFKLLKSRFEIKDWRYRQINYGRSLLEALEIPKPEYRTPANSLPPSEAEEMLIEAWLTDESLVTPLQSNATDSSILAAWPSTDTSATYLSVLNSLLNAESISTPAQLSLWHRASIINIDPDSLLLSTDPLRRIFTSALTQDVPSRRFMGLYRVLEHGYLTSILNELQSSYFSDPVEALRNAQDALKSEVEQLTALMNHHSLSTYFEDIHNLVDRMRGFNTFAAALVKKVKASRETKGQGSNKATHGARYFYQIRCAVAHAGTSRIFIEQYNDSEPLIEQVLEPAERAVHDYLKIKPISI